MCRRTIDRVVVRLLLYTWLLYYTFAEKLSMKIKATANKVAYLFFYAITTPTKHLVDVINDDIMFIFKDNNLINNTVQDKPP